MGLQLGHLGPRWSTYFQGSKWQLRTLSHSEEIWPIFHLELTLSAGFIVRLGGEAKPHNTATVTELNISAGEFE